MESELSSMSITRHIPPLSEEELSEGNSPVVANDSETHSDEDNDDEDEDEDGTLVLANLARDVHTRSVNMMKSEALDLSFPSVLEDTIPPPVPGKDYPRLGTFRKQSATSSNSDGVLHGGIDFTVDHDRSPSNPLLTPSTATSASSPPFTAPLASPEVVSSVSRPVRVKSEPVDEGARLRTLLKAETSSKVDDSFDLSSLDADLANLLSPNKYTQQNSALRQMVAAADAITPPLLSTPSNSDSNTSNNEQESSSEGKSSSSRRKKGKRISASSQDRERKSSDRPRSITTVVGQQSSPKRPSHSRPSSLTISTSSVTTSDLRRGSLDIPAVRSSRRATVFSREGGDVSPSAEDTGRYPLERSYSALGVTSPNTSFASTESLTRRRAVPKLYTPSRQRTTSNDLAARPASAFSVRPALKNWRKTRGDGGYEQDRERDLTSTPLPRSSSALGVTVSRRPSVAHTERTGTDRERDRTHQRSGVQARHRKRSMSVNETQPPSSIQRRSPGDWLGPRTVRLFRNAGLLDDTEKARDRERDREGASSVAGSRTESRLRVHTRASIDQDRPSTLERSLYTPSRAGFSEITRSSSWGRGSAGGSMTMAELTSARVESPITITSSTPTSTSNPKTTFSGSTATSVSGGSPNQPALHHPQFQLESLREKHQLEMEALLNALADSQRSGKSLRDENTMLKGRIRDLEEQIRDLVDRLNSTPQPVASTSSLSSLHRSILGNLSRPGSTEPLQRRHSRMQSYVLADSSPMDKSESEQDSLLTMRQPTPISSLRASPRASRFEGSATLSPNEHPARKRSSTSSSVFPVLPSNMSMLLHDDGDANDSLVNSSFSTYQMQAYGSMPSSPTAVLARPTPNASDSKSRHAPKPSVSSIGSNSSTNPDLTVASLPSSPGSLNLKPEHERHLGDMMSVDFSLGGESDG